MNVDVQKVLDQKSVILNLKFRAPGISRKGDLKLVETDADKTLLRLGTTILDSDEYRAIKAVARDCRAYLRAREIPTPTLRDGMHRIPVESLDGIYGRVKAAEAEYLARAEEFCEAYPALHESAKQRLGSQYNPANYPPVEELRKAFAVEWRLLDYGVPEAGKLGSVIHEAEWKKAQEEAKAEAEQCKLALRAATLAIVERFAKALGSRPDGKKARLTEKGWEAIEDFLKLFESRNVLQDSECGQYVEQLQQIVAGHDPGVLRKHDDVRAAVENQVQSILSGVSALVEAKGRAISFEEDE